MTKALAPRFSFNKGIVSRLALARVDVERIEVAAEEQTNWMPRMLGSMMLRPGMEYLGSVYNDAPARMLPFVFALDDTAALEITASGMRVWLDGALLTRPAVSSAVTNGAFDTDLTGWTDDDQSGAVSQWATGGYLSLTGTGANEARRTQLVTVAGPDQNVEHALTVVVERGIVVLRVGSTSGAVDYNEVVMRPGRHSISFTPTGNFYIQLASDLEAPALVDSIAVASSGAMQITGPWTANDLPNLRIEQSLDVIFVAWGGQPYRIERQDTRSWSIVKYLAVGPFLGENLGPITLAPSAAEGAITLTASADFFLPGHVGAQFRLETAGQEVSETITAEATFSDEIRITGISPARAFAVTVTGTFSANVVLQRSIGAPGDWSNVATYTVPTSTVVDDGLNNQEVYYRIGVETGGFTSGTVVVALAFAGGASTGIARVTSYVSPTVVNADVEEAFGTVEATTAWWEGAWSDVNGWPTSVVIYDGRLWWAGADRIDGSVSDNFASFDDTVEGDSGPILRTIGTGPSETINWLMALPQLLIGGQLSVFVAKSSSLEEPLTPTAFGLKGVSSLGSAQVEAAKVDQTGVYVSRNGRRVHEMAQDGTGYNYVSQDLMMLAPELGDSGVSRIAVARYPDTRIHCVRADGKVAVLVFDRAEKVTCWVLVETDGVVEDAITLPGGEEDEVYYVVNRTIDGNTKRYLERWAVEEEARGGAVTKLADSLVTYSGVSTTNITGLDHLEGETVVVWGNSKDLGSYTVTAGAITLSEAVTACYVGLPYTARYKTAKLAVASAAGVPLTQRKRIDHLGLILADTHAQGLRYGQSFDYLDDLPQIEAEAVVDPDSIWESYDADSVEVNGSWENDARLCLEASSPRPCTVLAAVIGIAGHDK